MGVKKLSFIQRTKEFRYRDGLKRHFIRKHLRHYATGRRIQRPHLKCDNIWLESGGLQQLAASNAIRYERSQSGFAK
jgi:hypothetical protein